MQSLVLNIVAAVIVFAFFIGWKALVDSNKDKKTTEDACDASVVKDAQKISNHF